jgi:hypothetical protein
MLQKTHCIRYGQIRIIMSWNRIDKSSTVKAEVCNGVTVITLTIADKQAVTVE